MATPQNVIANPLRAGTLTRGVRPGDPGLQLWVNSTLVDDMVSMGEISVRAGDMTYGSYRVGMKITDVPGTCTGFFWVGLEIALAELVELLLTKIFSIAATVRRLTWNFYRANSTRHQTLYFL